MYLSYFHLSQSPFSIAPDPHLLFMSHSHREALAHLLYGVNSGGGFVLLTGEIGAGKTTICRCLLEQLPEDCRAAYVFNPKLSVTELLRTICDEFGIAATGAGSVKDYVDQINAFLLAAHAAGRNSLLIIDEAQNLSADVLEQLRLLTNLETHTKKLLQIVLIGQPELRDMIAEPRLEQLAQRVIARYHLGPLDAGETAAYVRHRLLAAGGNGNGPFDAAALRAVHRHARGIPRRINLLCDRAMLGAYAQNRAGVDRAIVLRAAHEVFAGEGGSAILRRPAGALFGLLGVGAVLATAAAGYLVPPSRSVQPPASVLASASASASVPTLSGDPGAVIASLPLEDAPALRATIALWGIDASAPDPCAAVAEAGLRCYRGSGGLAELRALDRPAVIALVDARGTHYAELAGLGANTVALRAGGAVHVFSALALAPYFHGNFTTAWRAPAGFDAPVGATERGPAARWIAERLDVPGIDTGGQAFGTALTRAVRDFQQAQGLKADGVAGAKTMMFLNRATGIDEPRLPALANMAGG